MEETPGRGGRELVSEGNTEACKKTRTQKGAWTVDLLRLNARRGGNACENRVNQLYLCR